MKKIAVILIFFRRHCALEVLERVRAYAPERLFLVADGGRTKQEHEQCLEVRRHVHNAVDWPCKVETLYSDVNLGCRGNIPRGISWAFSKVDRAIILEDDTVPTHSFFTFCEEMLEYYKDDQRIMTISGTNYFPDHPCLGPYSYTFSGYAETCGYATWERSWRHYDADMLLWPKARDGGILHASFLDDPSEQKYWQEKFESVWNRTCLSDPYDFQYLFMCWQKNGLSIVPRFNLITNIGQGIEATHTIAPSSILFRSTKELHPPFVYPPIVIRNSEFDKMYGRYIFYGKPRSIVSRTISTVSKHLPGPIRRGLRQLKEHL